MRKRFLGLLIVLAFALPFVTAAPCFADTGETMINQITYEYDTETNEAAVVSSELEISGDVAIPETIEVDGQKYKVTSIRDFAFMGRFSLTGIIIPEGVTSIGDSAFASCFNMTQIAIPESATSIDRNAFRSCSSLTEVTLPKGLTSVGESTFDGCDGLTQITIPGSVTSIGNSAFAGCTSLTKVTIPNSVTSIGFGAFFNCFNLTDVYMENNLSLDNIPFDSSPDIHIWRYEVLKSTDNATYVKIVSVEDQGGSSIPNSFDIQCSAMGNGYVIDEVEPDNLSLKHALTKTEETPATCENPGNKECWTCTVCGKHFKDEGGTEPISSEDIEIPATGHSYKNGKCTVCGAIDPDFKAVITIGANGTWQKGTKDGLSFTSNAAFADFQKVSVDDKGLDASSYTVEEGSTIVTLQPSYLDTLSVGKHTLAIVSDTGTAETEFTVAAAEEQGVPEGQVTDNEVVNSGDKESLPKTGDGSALPIAVLSILAIASIVAGVLALRRSRI